MISCYNVMVYLFVLFAIYMQKSIQKNDTFKMCISVLYTSSLAKGVRFMRSRVDLKPLTKMFYKTVFYILYFNQKMKTSCTLIWCTVNAIYICFFDRHWWFHALIHTIKDKIYKLKCTFYTLKCIFNRLMCTVYRLMCRIYRLLCIFYTLKC